MDGRMERWIATTYLALPAPILRFSCGSKEATRSLALSASRGLHKGRKEGGVVQRLLTSGGRGSRASSGVHDHGHGRANASGGGPFAPGAGGRGISSASASGNGPDARAARCHRGGGLLGRGRGCGSGHVVVAAAHLGVAGTGRSGPDLRRAGSHRGHESRRSPLCVAPQATKSPYGG